VVEAIYVNSEGGVIRTQDLPVALRELTGEPGTSEEKRRLTEALFAMNWNVSKAAAKLQLSRMTVYRKLARYQIARESATPAL
jgi:transcriptional regulator of acetoin/glycerol metabolism